MQKDTSAEVVVTTLAEIASAIREFKFQRGVPDAELLEKFGPELRELAVQFKRRRSFRDAFMAFISTGDIEKLIFEVSRLSGQFALEVMVLQYLSDRKYRRERLSDRRESTTFDFEFAGLHYSCTHSAFADGRTGEVFLNNHKHDSASDLWARDAGILVSLALQFGAPLNVLRKALGRDSRDQPTSPIGAALDRIVQQGLPPPAST